VLSNLISEAYILIASSPPYYLIFIISSSVGYYLLIKDKINSSFLSLSTVLLIYSKPLEND